MKYLKRRVIITLDECCTVCPFYKEDYSSGYDYCSHPEIKACNQVAGQPRAIPMYDPFPYWCPLEEISDDDGQASK